jgi:transposase
LTPFHGHLIVQQIGVRHVKYQPPYPVEFRQQLVELVQAGRSVRELSAEFGPHLTSILSWVRKAGVNPAPDASALSKPLSSNERQELRELRRKVRQLQVERDILSKATAWFANPDSSTKCNV